MAGPFGHKMTGSPSSSSPSDVSDMDAMARLYQGGGPAPRPFGRGLIEPLGPHETAMEINNYPHLTGNECTSSPLASPELLRRSFGAGEIYADHDLQQQIASLKQHQHSQQMLLLQQYQQKRQQLEQEHEKQIQEHIKQQILRQQYQQQQQQLEQEHKKQLHGYLKGYFEQQQAKKLEQQQRMEKEMLEKERLDQIKNKNKDEESAVASSEVKQKLQDFVLAKKQREAAKELTNSPPQFRSPWVHTQSSLDQSSPPTSNMSPPYPHGILGKYDDDFPLRKTASEPNIYKVRSALKQKLETRRTMNTHSPLVRRRDQKALPLRRKVPLSIETGVCSSNPDSGPNSPPSGVVTALANGSLSSLHSKEDAGTYPFGPFRPNLGYPGNDMSLYTSPSLPNISLGRPPTSGPASASTSTSVSSEDELRAAMSARLGMPLSGPMLPGTLPGFYPALPVLDGEFPPGSSAAYLAAQSKMGPGLVSPYSIPTASGPTATMPEHPNPAHRLHRHRPLGRTHSAPLPLGHPVFQQQLLQQQQQQQQQHEQYLKENQKLYLKQHIRHTVLQRAGSKSHMENVDEETEAKLQQEMKESREAEAAAAESKMEEGSSELEKQMRERESFLGQQREIIKRSHRGPSHHRPLSRTQSSPLVTFNQSQADAGPVSYTFTTGLAYDPIMLKHQCTCNNDANHLEHAGRIQSIWACLCESGLDQRCERVRVRKATTEELQSCHTEMYTLVYGTNPLNRQKLLAEMAPLRFCLLPCGGCGVDSDTVWNEMHTSTAARTAAGCVLELAFRVAAGELKNGYAVVRPPGHHAEASQAMGFCYFNSVAIAAKQLQEKMKRTKILIVDWDVHHGNGTQQMFYTNPNVLYISLHRHDNGNFFPGTGAPDECGQEDGVGFNVNIAFGGTLNPPMGDAEYLAAFRTVVMPIARSFQPEVVLVSAGFDAAKGHAPPLGGYEVTPNCFGHMTRELMGLAGGKVALALEGGYDIPAICEASQACIRALLGDELPPIAKEELCRPPCKPAIETLETTIQIQSQHWPKVKDYLPTIPYSLMEAQRDSDEAATCTALASLSMLPAKRSSSVEQRESEPMEEGT